MAKLYDSLAQWWPLLSPPADYAEEAAFFAHALVAASDGPIQTVLELGSGGGNNASHLKMRFSMVLVELAPPVVGGRLRGAFRAFRSFRDRAWNLRGVRGHAPGSVGSQLLPISSRR
jgi:hypothetical protein